jgi:hypothetical protein
MSRRRRVQRQNFHRDSRVQARDEKSRWNDHVDLNEDDKIALVRAGGMEVEVPFEWEVCPQCDGDGSVVDPNIDAGGLSRRDMRRRGPGFREDYFSGKYDVDCPRCEGRRVVADLNPQKDAQEDVVEVLQETLRREASTDQMRRAERAMGA